ncbi:hypothetical protein [Streptomyces sp. NBC_00063]|uniref:hypothetical protein n=1 Tax=Streptomyces sp. NBC_00063 TaxID=2975638 RepID=UPI002252E1C3|nr:hypothetical protein [Streptomyces sp. NBC_00063]MCX5443911.1 hypothetical protein [Streptomyces sp. NBC_00063]
MTDRALEKRARTWLCGQYLNVRGDFEEDDALDEFEDVYDQVRAGGSALAALRQLGHDPALALGERRKDGIGAAGLWSEETEVNSVFRCPRASDRCTARRTRDEAGAWPMCYLDDPDGVPLTPTAAQPSHGGPG